MLVTYYLYLLSAKYIARFSLNFKIGLPVLAFCGIETCMKIYPKKIKPSLDLVALTSPPSSYLKEVI